MTTRSDEMDQVRDKELTGLIKEWQAEGLEVADIANILRQVADQMERTKGK